MWGIRKTQVVEICVINVRGFKRYVCGINKIQGVKVYVGD